MEMTKWAVHKAAHDKEQESYPDDYTVCGVITSSILGQE